MKVRIITIVILVGLLAFVWLSGTAQGKTSSQLHAELETLQEQAADIAADGAALQAELDANAQETRSTIEQKSAIDQAIHNTEAQIQNAEAQLQCVSLLIAQSQSDLEAAQQEQQALQEAYRQRLRAMEENGDVSYWAVLFGASSFQDLLSRIDMIHEVAEADQEMLRASPGKGRDGGGAAGDTAPGAGRASGHPRRTESHGGDPGGAARPGRRAASGAAGRRGVSQRGVPEEPGAGGRPAPGDFGGAAGL